MICLSNGNVSTFDIEALAGILASLMPYTAHSTSMRPLWLSSVCSSPSREDFWQAVGLHQQNILMPHAELIDKMNSRLGSEDKMPMDEQQDGENDDGLWYFPL